MMPGVDDLSAPYGNFMLGPRHGENVCSLCFNLTAGYERCYACAHGGRLLDAMLPISYSIGGEQLHYALAGYKRSPGAVARYFTVGLAAVLWRYLAAHEDCLRSALRIDAFDLVTTVPGSRSVEDPLHDMVSTLVAPVRGRYERLLRRSGAAVEQHKFSAERYEPIRRLDGEAVLLLDDTWTTGASAQSAAAALKTAGAEQVAATVIGRYVNRDWRDNDRHLRAMRQPFAWDECALCACSQHAEAATAAVTSTTR